MTILPSVHTAIITRAKELGVHPGRLIEWAWGVAVKKEKGK